MRQTVSLAQKVGKVWEEVKYCSEKCKRSKIR
ncbi:DUF2256 domain-containing protein [Mucilaginibacter sp. SMC90]|nr:DUF2256 domain-containing protein [Mucilaginibacter sp. SMC90]UOE52930.1 DUF2256 domain-containing protein [Mucilaginibacter sp. SMC90]